MQSHASASAMQQVSQVLRWLFAAHWWPDQVQRLELVAAGSNQCKSMALPQAEYAVSCLRTAEGMPSLPGQARRDCPPAMYAPGWIAALYIVVIMAVVGSDGPHPGPCQLPAWLLRTTISTCNQHPGSTQSRAPPDVQSGCPARLCDQPLRPLPAIHLAEAAHSQAPGP